VDHQTFLRRLPKVDLHCHLAGTIRPATLIELARKNGLALHTNDPEHLYDFADFADFYDFLDVVRTAARCLIDPDDFARVAYEALTDAATAGNLKYAELFFNPTDYRAPYPTVVDGFITGLRAAETEHGVVGRLIPSINRELGPAVAREMVTEVIAHRREHIVGIGMDGAERGGPPELFTEAYRLADRAGLHRTAHACEDNQTLVEAPPSNVGECLDELGCSRIDHGYNILADTYLVERCADEHIPFTVGSHTCVPSRLAKRWRNIRNMHASGLKLVVCTDDPRMYGTDIGTAYATISQQLQLPPDTAAQLAIDAIIATWLDDGDKQRLRKEFATEITQLTAQLAD
jgi:adenosine deaminase